MDLLVTSLDTPCSIRIFGVFKHVRAAYTAVIGSGRGAAW